MNIWLTYVFTASANAHNICLEAVAPIFQLGLHFGANIAAKCNAIGAI